MGKKQIKSRVQEDLSKCLVCGKSPTQIHHVFFGWGNRQNSEKYGYIVGLCMYHHTGSKDAVHCNKVLEHRLKRMCQEEFEKNVGTREEFRKIFGKSYLEGGFKW